jgi:UrcA family protein
MTRIAIAALAAIMSTAASANVSAIRLAGDTAYIGYGDLDLQSHAGRLKLTGRIRTAASRVCSFMDTSLEPLATTEACYRAAFQSGVEQMEAIVGPKSRG